MFGFFKKQLKFDAVAKEIFETFAGRLTRYGISYYQDEKELFQINLFADKKLQLTIRKKSSLYGLYALENKVNEVEIKDFKEVQFLTHNMLKPTLEHLGSILKSDKNFQNEQDLKAKEWFDLTVSNLIKASNDCLNSSDKIANFGIFFDKDKSELIVQAFNYDFIASYFPDPKIILTVYENKVVDGNQENSSSPIFQYEYKDNSLCVHDGFIQLLNSLAKQTIK